jgi:hypothetical protein
MITANSSPPEARHRVGGTHARAQAAVHLDQHAIARLVPQRAVDGLEAVQVHVEQRAGLVGVTAGPSRGVLEAVGQAGAVGEPGQRVVESGVTRGQGVAAALGDERGQQERRQG